MNPSDPEFVELCSELLDGTLGDKDRARLLALLVGDAELLAGFRKQLLVSGSLDRLKPERNDATFVRSVLPHIRAVSGEADHEFSGQVMSRIRFARFRRGAVAMAALVALLAALLVFLKRETAHSAAAIAKLYTDGDSGPRDVRPGEKLALTNGVTRIEFANGAVVAVQAPASLIVRSADQIILTSGRLNAWCPESAHGFKVVTSGATLTDLGTSFGISADNGTADFVVLEGKVKVSKDAEIRTIERGNAVRSDHSAGLRDLKFEPTPFLLTWPVASGIRSTLGEVVPAPPDTPEALARLENDDHIFVIPERRDFIPDVQIPVDITLPGKYSGNNLRHPSHLDLKPEQRLRSYLLRYNPVGVYKPGDYKLFEGSVTFDRPVIGIIVGSGKLNRTDSLLSKAPLPKLDPAEEVLRGLEGSQTATGSDRVSLSDDRLTVKVTFYAGESIDEIRAITTDD
ncbi:MAG: FecR domain-containing protein [Luteolibacter sp.]|uniref:FecR domain-containing protein n=1 Tax=Luteolibacter sp. TaxID=1962973 RepID=UPI003265E6D7